MTTDSAADQGPEVAASSGQARGTARFHTSRWQIRSASNGERAGAAVTRYGGCRGESSEGCRGLGDGLPAGGASLRPCWLDLKRAEPHDRVQGATDLRGTRGARRRSREERQGRNMSEVGISDRRAGHRPGVDARALSRWRGVFGKPEEVRGERRAQSSTLTVQRGDHPVSVSMDPWLE
jgi:hypothetical protein